MDRTRRAVLFAFTCACLGLPVAGCDGSNSISPTGDPLAYDRHAPLHAAVSDAGSEAGVRLQRVDYTTFDGSRVPALFAIPTGAPPRGCLIYQGGIGQTKEALSQVRDGAAVAPLFLATFTIDPRDTGARGSDQRLRAAIQSPEAMASLLRDTAIDLRRALDYLQTRPECRGNIGFMGTSLGGALGAIVAGADARVKAAVLTSLGATWREALLASDAARGLPYPLLPGVARDAKRFAAAVRTLAPYDPARWVAKIAPRPVMLVNGRADPVVPPRDALDLADAAQDPKTPVYFNGGHDPLQSRPVVTQIAYFLLANVAS